MHKGILGAFMIAVLISLYIQVDGQTTDCIQKNQVCTRIKYDNRPCCNSQGPPCPPNTRDNCRFIRCRERYGQGQWHWYCLHWNYYRAYARRSVSSMDNDYEAESDGPGKFIGSGLASSRTHKLAELQQEIVEQLNRIADTVETKMKASGGSSSDPAPDPEPAPAPDEATAAQPAQDAGE